MQTVKRTYRPKSGHEGCAVTFPNPLTGETVNITSWPHETTSSVEMAHLDGHPWITDRPAPSSGFAQTSGEMPLSKMTKAELLTEAEGRGLTSEEANEGMTKATIRDAISVAAPATADENTDGSGGDNAASPDTGGSE